MADRVLRDIKSLARENGYRAKFTPVKSETKAMASGHVHIDYHDQATLSYHASIWYEIPKVCDDGAYIGVPHFYSDGVIEDWPAFLTACNNVEKLREKIASYLDSVGQRQTEENDWKLDPSKIK